MEITLKRISVKDLVSLASDCAPAAVAHPALPNALPPAFVAERALTHLAAGKPIEQCPTFYITDSQGCIVGGCGFKDAPCNGEIEVGYAVAPEARGQGVGKAAVRLLLELASGFPEVGVVVANINPDNLHSTHLVQSLGFLSAGEFTDPSGERLMRWCWSAPPNNSSKPPPLRGAA